MQRNSTSAQLNFKLAQCSMLTISMVLLGGKKNTKKSKRLAAKRPGFAVFPAPCASPPAGMCSFSRHGEGDRDSYCCRTKLHARWMGLQAPAIVKGLNKSRLVETQRRRLPLPRAFQASGRDAHKHSWPPSMCGTRSALWRKRCSNPTHPLRRFIFIQVEERQQTRGRRRGRRWTQLH